MPHIALKPISPIVPQDLATLQVRLLSMILVVDDLSKGLAEQAQRILNLEAQIACPKPR